ncbi:unnamed protein product, partial [Ixodes pacificus]
ATVFHREQSSKLIFIQCTFISIKLFTFTLYQPCLIQLVLQLGVFYFQEPARHWAGHLPVGVSCYVNHSREMTFPPPYCVL